MKNTSSFIVSSILSALFLTLVTAKPSTPPNILILYADDQRNDTLGCAGHPIVKTPNIDQLAQKGVRFENAFVSTSTCWIGRASLFTGCYERKHLYGSSNDRFLNSKLCESSYFAVLKKGGYRTGHLGKEHVRLSIESAGAMFDVRRKLGRNPYFKKRPDGSLRHETQILGDWAIEFLHKQPKNQPFCLQLSFNAPHAEDRDRRPGAGHYPWPKVTNGMYEEQNMPLPKLNDPSIYDSQPEFLRMSLNSKRYRWRWDTLEKYQTNMRAYLRMISGIDHVAGRMVEALEQNGLAENTIIIYTADNGYYLGDRGFAGKWTHYDQSLRVPLIIFDPRLEKNKRGRVVSEMALNSDLASTIIDIANFQIPDSHTGKSLTPLIQGVEVPLWRTDFLCEFLAVPKTIPPWEGIRSSEWLYARYFVNGIKESPFEFLHDLRNDPDQINNLASNRNKFSKLQEMRDRCDEKIAIFGPTMAKVYETSPKLKSKK